MDVFEYYMKEARRNLDAAEYSRTVSYSLSRDSKLFLDAVKKIHQAHTNILSLLLTLDSSIKTVAECDVLSKRNFSEGLERVKKLSNDKQLCTEDECGCMKDAFEIVTKHEQSPVEFPRNTSFIMCDESYATTGISFEKVKDLAERTRRLLHSVFKNRELLLSASKEKMTKSTSTI